MHNNPAHIAAFGTSTRGCRAGWEIEAYALHRRVSERASEMSLLFRTRRCSRDRVDTRICFLYPSDPPGSASSYYSRTCQYHTLIYSFQLHRWGYEELHLCIESGLEHAPHIGSNVTRVTESLSTHDHSQ